MLVRIRKWGNSLALRIPRAFALETSIESGTEVELSLEDGRLVITPSLTRTYDLAKLLSGVTPDNVHHEIDTGPATGAEAW